MYSSNTECCTSEGCASESSADDDLAPDIGPGFKHISFRQLGIATAFQVVLEKRKEDVLPVVIAGIREKFDVSQPFSVETSPTAMHPWTHDEGVEVRGIVFFDRTKLGQRTLQILGIKPSADGQHRAMNVLKVRREVAHFPVVVVRIVPELVVPERGIAAEIISKVSDRAGLQEKVVAILGAVVELQFVF